LACRKVGVKVVAVTAGYVEPRPLRELAAVLDAANVDLKAFTDDFYHRVCGGALDPVLRNLEYLVHETDVWVELTTLLIPGLNDSDAELDLMTRWVVDRLGPDIPMHFTAFHPDFKMRDREPTPPSTLTRARRIALINGVNHAYTGNVHDPDGQSTRCPGCGSVLIARNGYQLGRWHLSDQGACLTCGAPLAGVIDGPPGDWGSRRQPVRMSPPGRSAS